jgi:hypothetical protein
LARASFHDLPVLYSGMQQEVLFMVDIYQITITTSSKETFTGKMKCSQPEIINGFVALATDNGEWHYFKPDSVEQFHIVPMAAETKE